MEQFIFSPLALEQAAHHWLAEDISSTDVGGAVVGMHDYRATFFVKSNCVLAGFPFVDALCKLMECRVEWLVKEGTLIPGSSTNRVPVGRIVGPAARILQIERTALEALTRCSACATYARMCVDNASRSPEWAGVVAATRKTTPGSFRLVEKYGAIVGGAHPHRYNLSSMVMLKDNHIDMAGSITASVKKARSLCGFSTKIEVECRSVKDALEALEAGADIVMLDNFRPHSASVGAQEIKKKYPYATVEVSGGITAETIEGFALKGVDVLSVGRITHGPPPVDISLKAEKSELSSKL